MGLSNTASTGGTFVTLYKGYWGKRASEGVEGAVSRERGGTGDNAKDIIWELQYNTLSGIIKNAYIEDGKFGQSLVLVLDDNGETITAKMKADGRQAEALIKSLPNLKYGEEVELQAYVNKKGYGALGINQGGEKVKWAYSKEEPNGMPQATKKTVKGKEQWDFSEQENFIYEKLTEWLEGFDGAPTKDEDGGMVGEDEL
jgi:hypothetical protein